MIAASIVRAEMLRSLRSTGAPLAAVLAVSAAATALAWSWPTGAAAPDQRAAISIGVFRTLLLAQVIAVGTFGPLLVAGTLVGEREQDTWDLLRTTALRTHELITAKAAAAVGLILALVLLTLPLWGACLLLGAVSTTQFAAALLVMAGEAAWLAGVGVWASAVARSVFTASAGALCGAAPGVVFAAWCAAGVAQVAGRPLTFGVLGLLGGIAVGLPLLWHAIRVAGRAPERSHGAPLQTLAERARRAGWWELGLRRDRFPDRLLLRPERPSEWPDDADPFYLREASGDVGGLGGVMLRLALVGGAIAIMLLSVAAAAFPDAWLALTIALVGAGAGATAAAQALPSARAQGTLDLLRTVPGAVARLPAAQVLAALRLAGGIAAALTLLATPGLLVHAIRVGWVRGSAVTAILHPSTAVLAELLLVAGAVGLGVGMGTLAAGCFRRSTAALVAALLAVTVVVAGPPLVQQWREAVLDRDGVQVYTGSSLDELSDALDPENQWLPWVSVERAVRGGTEWFERPNGGVWIKTQGENRGGPDVLRLLVMASWLAGLGLIAGVAGMAGMRRQLRPE